MALRSLLVLSKEMRSLLTKNANMQWIRRQEKSNLTPLGDWFGDLFKKQTIMDNWETIPIFVTAAIQASFPIIASIWFFMNAQEIRLWPGSKMKSQTHRQILEGPPKPTRWIVINQKWEWPQGLIDAIKKDGKDGKSVDPCKDKVQSVSFKFWKKN